MSNAEFAIVITAPTDRTVVSLGETRENREMSIGVLLLVCIR